MYIRMYVPVKFDFIFQGSHTSRVPPTSAVSTKLCAEHKVCKQLSMSVQLHI